MGLDISSHAVDTALFRDRLVPFVKDGKPIDDLIARAARVAVASARAATWRIAAMRFSWALQGAQEAVVPKVTERYTEPARKPYVFERLFGIKPPMETKEFTHPERVPGLIGFDSDLASFGRPFFMPVDGTDNVLALYDRYLATVGQGDAAVDDVARAMVRELSAKALNFPAGTRPAVFEATKNYLPLEKHIVPTADDADPPLTVAEYEKRLTRETQLWRFVFVNRKTDVTMPAELIDPDDEGDEPVPAREYLTSLPLRMVGFAAVLMPGWMSRGYGYATSLFDKIGVKASHIFETPEPLLSELAAAAPAMRSALRTTIIDNFSLGGYVPPQKMGAFVDLLRKHERALILAFHNGPPPSPELLTHLHSDYIKILEPATYALKNGCGYLEAAEIYSGPLGWGN